MIERCPSPPSYATLLRPANAGLSPAMIPPRSYFMFNTRFVPPGRNTACKAVAGGDSGQGWRTMGGRYRGG